MTDQPIPFRHGNAGPSATGYRKGCRCAGCRKAKREDQAAYRAAKKLKESGGPAPAFEPAAPLVEPSSVGISWDAPAGPIEQALDGELAALIGEPPFKKTLIVLARYNARVLDQIPAAERFDLVSGMESRLFNVFDRLRRVESAPGAGSWDMSGLLQPDAADEQ
ncbi:hypothetical protein [Arthrobacter sp. B1805]|uniref:hypothetical protein n=1 Tax=Arthrobacter sp. B1805 TaxID=2058892 RepID=UPI000CE36EC4|nr:hypothetical protein [Arthrobacter sp. B1805]